MTTMDRPAAKLDIGRVVRDTFGVIRRRPGPLILPAVFFAIVGGAANYMNMQTVFSAATTAGAGRAAAIGRTPMFSTAMVIYVIVAIPVGLIWTSVIQYTTATELDGRSEDLASIVRVGLRRALPVLGLLILWMLGVMAATMLLVVPGIILALMWGSSLPAVVNEPIGVIAAFGRSRALTKGNRWRLLGLFVLLYVAVVALEAVIFGTLGALGGLQRAPLLFATAGSLFGAFFGLVVYVMLAAVYVQLRDLKGGLGSESAARVFE